MWAPTSAMELAARSAPEMTLADVMPLHGFLITATSLLGYGLGADFRASGVRGEIPEVVSRIYI